MNGRQPDRSEAVGPITLDEAYLRRLIEECGPFLQRFLLSRGAPVSDVQDLVQESFTIFWEKRQSAKPGKEPAFLNGIARHVLLNHRRRMLFRESIVNRHASLIAEQTHSGSCPASSQFTQDEQNQHVEGLFRQLPPKMGQIMRALYLEGKTRKEVARLRGITLRVVAKAEAEALKKLRHLGNVSPDIDAQA